MTYTSVFLVLLVIFLARSRSDNFVQTGRDEWTRDDDKFISMFKYSALSAYDKRAYWAYHYGPIFFSKRFKSKARANQQQKAIRYWRTFLDHVSVRNSTGNGTRLV